MRLAWLSASDSTRSPGRTTAWRRPRLAAYPEPNSEGGLAAAEGRQALLEIGEGPEVAAQQARSRGPRAQAGQGRPHRFHEMGVPGQAQEVVRREVEALGLTEAAAQPGRLEGGELVAELREVVLEGAHAAHPRTVTPGSG